MLIDDDLFKNNDSKNQQKQNTIVAFFFCKNVVEIAKWKQLAFTETMGRSLHSWDVANIASCCMVQKGVVQSSWPRESIAFHACAFSSSSRDRSVCARFETISAQSQNHSEFYLTIPLYTVCYLLLEWRALAGVTICIYIEHSSDQKSILNTLDNCSDLRVAALIITLSCWPLSRFFKVSPAHSFIKM